jgi:hypothetical protein
VKPLVRPEIDAAKLARAFIWLAKDLAAKQQEEGGDQQRPP